MINLESTGGSINKMSFRIKSLNKKLNIKNPILIEGLPGIGNVGKITIDFMIEILKADKILEIHSNSFPNSVFVNEENLVDLPTIEIFHKRLKGKDFLFLAGDVQPFDETSCYEFCEEVLNVFEKYNGSEIITTGGIGLPNIPKNPEVFCTGNSKSIIKQYKDLNVNNNIFGVVGPIIGVSGLLIGLAKNRNIPAISLLAQTYGHPSYLGIKGAKEILKIINKKFGLGMDLKYLDKEIKELDKDNVSKQRLIGSLKKQKQKNLFSDTNYIG